MKYSKELYENFEKMFKTRVEEIDGRKVIVVLKAVKDLFYADLFYMYFNKDGEYVGSETKRTTWEESGF